MTFAYCSVIIKYFIEPVDYLFIYLLDRIHPSRLNNHGFLVRYSPFKEFEETEVRSMEYH